MAAASYSANWAVFGAINTSPSDSLNLMLDKPADSQESAGLR